MKKITRIFFAVLLIMLFLAIITIIASQYSTDKTINLNIFNSAAPKQNPNHELNYAGWIPYWGSEAGLESLKINADKLNFLSPVWYEVKDDGSLINKVSSNAEEIKTITKNNNIKLVPAIAMFDHELFSSVLHEQNNLDRHVDQIYKTVMSNNYDGIDLDYESTKLADKELYFEFLKKLSLKLKQNNKILIVTVLAKWGDQIKYPSLPETREVQDWQRIAELANQVRIMAYDYTFIQSQFPGPIAPLNWVKDILDYAVTKIPREKIILGIHLYAYEWWLEVDENTDQEFSTLTFITNYLLNNNSEKSARSYTYETVQRVLTENNGKKSQYQGEQIFEYQKVNDVTKKLENRILIYIDPEGIKKRAELAKQYQIAGVAYWRIGGEAGLLDN